MTPVDLKPTLVAALVMFDVMTAAFANGEYWVVGNLVTNSCDIVSQTPVVSSDVPLWFGNGPHKTYDAARLARQGISACARMN